MIGVLVSVVVVVLLFELALFCTSVAMLAITERGRGWVRAGVAWGVAAVLVDVVGRELGYPLPAKAGVIAGVALTGLLWAMKARDARPQLGAHRVRGRTHTPGTVGRSAGSWRSSS